MNEKKTTVLAVDDEELNLVLLESMLTPLGYNVLRAKSGEEALDIVESNPPDIILLDVMMPGINGFEVVSKIKSNKLTMTIPIVMVTGLKDVEYRVKALEAGADDFLTKPLDKTELRARVRSLEKLKSYNDYMLNYQKELEKEVDKRTKELQDAFNKIKLSSLDTIYRLSKSAVYKDEGTGYHIKRISLYAASVGKKIGLEAKEVEALLYASPMHDIGKIGIPDRILLKPGKLDPDEWEIMKTHTKIGAKILEDSDAEFIRLAESIALSHHEKWDGSGYPNGIKGKNIPLAARITTLVDIFDALTTSRPYKEAFSLEKSFDIIRSYNGTFLDPSLVETFFEIEEEILTIKEEYKDNNEALFFNF